MLKLKQDLMVTLLLKVIFEKMRMVILLGSLNLSNNYFGLDEKIVSVDKKSITHVNVNDYDDNTNGIRVKGTY